MTDTNPEYYTQQNYQSITIDRGKKKFNTKTKFSIQSCKVTRRKIPVKKTKEVNNPKTVNQKIGRNAQYISIEIYNHYSSLTINTNGLNSQIKKRQANKID